jgi:hypothetical protein
VKKGNDGGLRRRVQTIYGNAIPIGGGPDFTAQENLRARREKGSPYSLLVSPGEPAWGMKSGHCAGQSVFDISVVRLQIGLKIGNAATATTSTAGMNHDQLHEWERIGALAFEDLLKSGGRTATIGAVVDFLGLGGHGRNLCSVEKKRTDTLVIARAWCKGMVFYGLIAHPSLSGSGLVSVRVNMTP